MIHIRKREDPTLQPLLDQAKRGDKEEIYRGGAVFEAIKEDFHKKCYICEDNEITSIQIDHFQPHKGDRELKYQFTNLFYSCGHCNNLKGHTLWPLLDCTNPDHRIWESVEIIFSSFPKTAVQIAIHNLADRQAAENTKLLLEKSLAGKGTTVMKQEEAQILRQKMNRALTALLQAIDKNAKTDIQHLISNQAAFSGMLRWHLKQNFFPLYQELQADSMRAGPPQLPPLEQDEISSCSKQLGSKGRWPFAESAERQSLLASRVKTSPPA